MIRLDVTWVSFAHWATSKAQNIARFVSSMFTAS